MEGLAVLLIAILTLSAYMCICCDLCLLMTL